MAANIDEIRRKLAARVKDDAAKLSTTPDTGDIDLAIASALEQYSKDRPREVVAEVTGAGTHRYAVSGLTGFVDGFSSVLGVAYPYTAADRSLLWLDADEFSLERVPAGLELWFESAEPGATEAFLVKFSALHTLTSQASTVPASDDNALADLAAAFALEALASLYAQSVDSAISADAVDRKSKSAEYASRAKRFRELYADKVGGGESKAAPASARVEMDRRFSNAAGTDYFFHGRRRF